MKVAINRCWGGFGVSKAVFKELGIEWDGYGSLTNEELGVDSDNYEAYRADPRFVAAIEKVGCKKASGDYAEIEIVSIPDDVDWYIHEYDGQERVHENHRSWQNQAVVYIQFRQSSNFPFTYPTTYDMIVDRCGRNSVVEDASYKCVVTGSNPVAHTK